MINPYARYGSTVAFSEDENTVIVDGARFLAVDGEAGKCANCLFKAGFSCALAEAVLRQEPTSVTVSRCSEPHRVDGRDITWRKP